MKLLFGLGNPGKEYEKNRHNIGFMFVEYLLKQLGPETKFTPNDRFASRLAEVAHKGNKYLFVEPQSFMNRSGEPLSRLAHFYKIPLGEIIVFHDDLDIPLGKFKVQTGTGPKLHGGLSSIEQLLGTKEFWRVRLGVENRKPENYLPGEDYVLQNFSHEEAQTLPSLFERVYQQLLLNKML